MRKFYVLFLLSLFAVKVYGIHNLLIDGSSAATVTIEDTFEVTANFKENGAVGNGILYYDINGDGVLDGGDIWVAKFRLIDGNWADEDELDNGIYCERREPIPMIGKFLFYAEDNGESDTVAIQVNPCSSPHTVHGKLTNPATTPGIFICIGDTTGGILEYHCGDFTDNTGAYSISVPEVFAYKSKILMAVDILGITENLMSNSLNDTVYISGSREKDIGMQSVLPDTSVIWGTLKDDLEAPITGEVLLFGAELSLGGGKTGAVGSRTNMDGTYRVPLAQITGTGYYYFFISATLVDQFYPDYMNPNIGSAAGKNPSPPQLNIELKAYRTTNTISGKVLFLEDPDWVPLDNIQIDISAVDPQGLGGTYTKSYSDGRYIADVSDSINKYSVKISPNYTLPSGYEIAEGDTVERGPGATNVDFHITNVAVEETPLSESHFTVQPNPFISDVIFEIPIGTQYIEPLHIYDITGKRVVILTAESSKGLAKFTLREKDKSLPAGVYFYSLRTKNKTYEGKLIKLR